MAQLPAVINTKEAIERYSKGESIREIAKSFGCSHVALYNRLMAEAPEDWKAIASANALASLDEAENELKTAPDMLTVTRARGWAEIQRWKLERLLRRYFGQDSIPQGANAVQININLRRSADQTAPSDTQVIDIPVDRD